MSYIVAIKTQVRDVNALRAACQRRRLEPPIHGSNRLFTSTVEGWAVNLPDWRYPVVCQTETGDVKFDNYNGRWGDQQHLDGLLQSYAVEKTKIEARKAGHSVTEQALQDGSIKLTVAVGGVTS